DMPQAGPLTRATLRHPAVMGFVLSNIPHTLGSVLCILYNVLRIGTDLPDPRQQQLVMWLTVSYTGVVFMVANIVAAWAIAPGLRFRRRLAGGEVLGPTELTAERRRVLREPLWAILLTAVGWLPGIVIVPLLLDWLSFPAPVEPGIYLHFAISFTVAG